MYKPKNEHFLTTGIEVKKDNKKVISLQFLTFKISFRNSKVYQIQKFHQKIKPARQNVHLFLEGEDDEVICNKKKMLQMYKKDK